MTLAKYSDLYSYRTRSDAPLGTALFVVDVFTIIASIANTVETVALKENQLNSGKIDVAADVAQLIFYIYEFNKLNVLADVQIRILIVLRLARDIIVALEQLNGFGHPNNGDQFIDSAAMLKSVVATLAAVDSEEWSGRAVGIYGTRRERQQSSAESIADADRELAKIVHRQANQVEQGREAFASIRLGLYLAMPLAFAYGLCVGTFANPKMTITESSREIPDPADPLARIEKYLYTVVGLAGVAALTTAVALIICGSINAEDMESPIDIYRDIANQAGVSPTIAIVGEAPPSFPVALPGRSGRGGEPSGNSELLVGSGMLGFAAVAAAVGGLSPAAGRSAPRSGSWPKRRDLVNQKTENVPQLAEKNDRAAPGRVIADQNGVRAGERLGQETESATTEAYRSGMH